MPKYRMIDDGVATLRNLVEFESTSESMSGRKHAREFIVHLLEDFCGADVQIVRGAGVPAIAATINGNSDEAVLFYGHYDVMVAGDSGYWGTPPFELTTRNNRLFGRGAGDNKGQLVATIIGLNHFLVAHPNHKQTFKLIIEGEEEQGSKHLQEIVEKISRTVLSNVRDVVVTDGSMSESGAHVLRLANRGLFGFKLLITTAEHDNHSGNAGNVVANPVITFQRVLNDLFDVKQNKVLIPGFYEGVIDPTTKDDEDIARLPFNYESLVHVFGGSIQATDKFDYYHKLMFNPTFNVSGIESGYNGPGVKTIIPGDLTAHINMRLVGHQRIDRIHEGLDDVLRPYIDAGAVRYQVEGAIPPATTVATASDRNRFEAAAQQANVPLLVEPCMPGTVPNYVWTDVLKAKVFTLPLANFDQNNHSNDENITVEAFNEGIRFIQAVAEQYEKEA